MNISEKKSIAPFSASFTTLNRAKLENFHYRQKSNHVHQISHCVALSQLAIERNQQVMEGLLHMFSLLHTWKLSPAICECGGGERGLHNKINGCDQLGGAAALGLTS